MISLRWDACHRRGRSPSYSLSMDEEPLLRVIRGTPTAEELAALVAGLATRSRAARSNQADRVSTVTTARSWVRSARPGAGVSPGRGAWRAAGLPR